MQLSVVFATVLLLLHRAVAFFSNDTIYLLTANSQPVGGSTETLCVHVHTAQKSLLLHVTLEHGQTSKTLLSQTVVSQDHYQCVSFKVPAVSIDTEASIVFEVKGKTTFLNGTTKILIKPPAQLTIIATDKPLYKPGQTVKIRIVSLDSNFLTYNGMFSTVELQDPNSNRIGQWLNMSTSSGFLDLSYPVSPEAAEGFYVITAWNEGNEPITQDFEIKKYVLPKFEVTIELPPVITVLDTKVTLKVCAKYTYGKPVMGSATAVVCRRSYGYWWFAPGPAQLPDICRTFTMKTDRTGCGSYIVDLSDFALNDTRYEDIINVDAELEEYGTGVVLSGSGSSTVTSDIVTLTFVDAPDTFRLGLTYKGKIKATGPDSAPMKNESVYLVVNYAGNKNASWKLVTDGNGVAPFSLDTRSWGSQSVSLEAQYLEEKKPLGNMANMRTPNYLFAYLLVQPFYSQSRSFLALQRPLEVFRCNGHATALVQYIIQGNALEPTQLSLDFFYMVMSRGRMVQTGSISVAVQPERENRGGVVVPLQDVRALSPLVQVVVYAMLPRGEVVADSMDFPVELCLANEVSLNFSSPVELPGSSVELMLKARPGSLCSVRAIDRSLLLLSPDKELSVESVFKLLPVYKLSGYPDGTEDFYPCSEMPPRLPKPLLNARLAFPGPYNGNVDVYHVFKDAGIKTITNVDLRKPFDCRTLWKFGFENVAFAKELPVGSGETPSDQNPPAATVRRYFPETWIWDLVYVGTSGFTRVNETVPDTITTWEGGAFCTSPVGFGVAPKVDLTAFQPFFVSLTLPYSIVRGEVFTLKATVFNYLPSCIMVQVMLASSNQFSVQPCKSCIYTHCLCADDGWTFTWVVTPSVLGEVVFTVTAEAVQTSALCGNRVTGVPEKGRMDTVVQTLLVEAEGTKQSNAYNELLCPAGVVERNVTLKLPKVIVQGSPTAFVSVLGDLMGHALQNLDNLLAMPYGCGEQNMLLFAPDIFILGYLESSGQLTPAIRSKATSFLLSGYQRELTYKHEDGSYSAFGTSDNSGNTWLTAFVMKSFESAKQYIFIDQTVIDQAKTWLGNKQQLNGCFASVGNLIHVDMQGGVNDEVTLSAYVTAALLELGTQRTDPMVSKGLDCLRNISAQVNSTYAIALLSYTFTLAGDQVMRGTLLSRLNQRAVVTVDGRHWGSGRVGTVTDSLDVETTSYVLLAVLSGPLLPQFELGYSAGIVRWLGQQQNAFGGFASTQDTVVALQALAKYSTATYSTTGTIAVTVTSPLGSKTQFTVNQSNRLLYQQIQLQEVTGVYNVRASGQGCVFVQFTQHYNIPPPNDFSSFSIAVNTSSNCSAPNLSVGVTVTVRYNGNRTETDMVVIEVKLLSGFSLVEGSLMPVAGSTEVKGTVKRVDPTERNVVIYLNGLKKGETKTYTLVIQQDIAVQNLKPAVVKIYDYYQPSDVAVTQYTSPCNER
ncbi:alpha-2-macroglobulin-like protein 1 [Electrophorus electricus]|uniref:alpha-2-macroglobulin-like protein 1 n=1 Tax=Electrophorus electricus TaxID=8005 RepID=UPI0015CFC13F|nr:alpha-2-macroglobulin-like protein 1 [Electrophorus electricus]